MKSTAKTLRLILVLIAFSVMAMGSGSSSSGTSASSSKASSSSSEKKDEGAAGKQEQPKENAAAMIEESVVFDQDGIKITAKGLDFSGLFGPEIKLLIENDSSANITVQSRNTSVNGYMVETSMSADVAAGKKANDELTIMSTSLSTAGITDIADIEFSFHIFDTDTWNTILDSDVIRIETSLADGFTYTYDDSGEEVYNVNGLKIVVKGLSEDDSWLGPSILVYIQNESGQDLTVQVRDVSVNGFMVDSIFSSDVNNGKHALDTITFLSSDLEENEIETIESVELSFHIFEWSSLNTIADTSPVTINF